MPTPLVSSATEPAAARLQRVLVSAGEPSGDRLAAGLLAALLRRHPGLEVSGMAGERSRAAGFRGMPMPHGTPMGFVEVLRAVPAHARLLRRMAADAHRTQPDVAVLVDYPGFHLRLAERLTRAGIPVLGYVAPQLWAWGAWRVVRVRRVLRHIAAILPFEERFFRERGIPATFVGHPILDSHHPRDRPAARRRLGMGVDAPVIGLLPGSRPGDVGRHWVPLRDASALVREVVGGAALVAAVPGVRYPGAEAGGIVPVFDADEVLAAADVVICKSGTSTIQAMLHRTPMVVAYRAHPLSIWLARRLVTVDHIALPNILAHRAVVPEFVQEAVTARRLADAALVVLEEPVATVQRLAFDALEPQLGRPGVADRVAELAESLVQ